MLNHLPRILLFIIILFTALQLPACNRNKAQAYYFLATELTIQMYTGKIKKTPEKVDQVIEYYEKAMTYAPENDFLFFQFIKYLIKEKFYDKAFEKVFSRTPENENFVLLLTEYLVKEQFYNKAFNVFEKAIQLKPNNPGYHNAYAWTLLTIKDIQKRNPNKALKHAKIANDLTENKEAMYLDTLAKAHNDSGDKQKACEIQTQVIKLGKSSPYFNEFRKRYQEYCDGTKK